MEKSKYAKKIKISSIVFKLPIVQGRDTWRIQREPDPSTRDSALTSRTDPDVSAVVQRHVERLRVEEEAAPWKPR